MDRFMEQVVVKKQRGLNEVLYVLAMISMVLFALLGMMYLQMLFYAFSVPALVITVILLGGAVLLFLYRDRLRAEYEYTFTNGDVDFAMVFNNQKRKSLGSLKVTRVDAFGPVKSVYVEKDKLSDLELPYPDSWFVTLRHENGTKGFLAADVVSPKAVRNFECFGEGLHLFWEGSPSSLYHFDHATGRKNPVCTYQTVEHDSRYSDNIVENAYVDELTNFFGVLNGTQQPRYSFEKDQATIELIERIERF